MLTGIERILTSNGFSMLVYLRKREAGADELIRSLHSKLVSGIIIAADCIDNSLAQKVWKFKIETLLSLCLTTQLRDISSCEGCFLIIIEVGVSRKYLFSMDIAGSLDF